MMAGVSGCESFDDIMIEATIRLPEARKFWMVSFWFVLVSFWFLFVPFWL